MTVSKGCANIRDVDGVTRCHNKKIGGMKMCNEQLINKIKNGAYADQKDAFKVIQNKGLADHDSFKRSLKNEYVYEANKGNADLAVLQALENFYIDLIAYTEQNF